MKYRKLDEDAKNKNKVVKGYGRGKASGINKQQQVNKRGRKTWLEKMNLNEANNQIPEAA